MPSPPLRIPRLVARASLLFAPLIVAAGCAGDRRPATPASAETSGLGAATEEAPHLLRFEEANEVVQTQCRGRLVRVVRFDSWIAAASAMSPGAFPGLPQEADALRDAFVQTSFAGREEREAPHPPYVAADPDTSSPRALHLVVEDDSAVEGGGVFVVLNVGETSVGSCPSTELRVERNHDRRRELLVSSEGARFVEGPCPEVPGATRSTLSPQRLEALRELVRARDGAPPETVEDEAPVTDEEQMCGTCESTASRAYSYNGTHTGGFYLVTETTEEDALDRGRPFIDVVSSPDHVAISGCGDTILVQSAGTEGS